MKFKEYDICQVEAQAYNRPKLVKFLHEFVDSGVQCAVVEDYEQKNAYICACSLRKAALKERLYHVKITVRKDNVYLINTLLVDKKKTE